MSNREEGPMERIQDTPMFVVCRIIEGCIRELGFQGLPEAKVHARVVREKLYDKVWIESGYTRATL